MIRVAKFASISVPLSSIAAIALVIGLAAPTMAASRHGQPLGQTHSQIHGQTVAKASAHRAGRSLYDVAPAASGGKGAVNSDDPSLTGGGSLGYNQNIYNW